MTALDQSSAEDYGVDPRRHQAVVYTLQFCNTAAAGNAGTSTGFVPDFSTTARDIFDFLCGKNRHSEFVETGTDNVIHVDFNTGCDPKE